MKPATGFYVRRNATRAGTLIDVKAEARYDPRFPQQIQETETTCGRVTQRKITKRNKTERGRDSGTYLAVLGDVVQLIFEAREDAVRCAKRGWARNDMRLADAVVVE